jgi:hypothetical protein
MRRCIIVPSILVGMVVAFISSSCDRTVEEQKIAALREAQSYLGLKESDLRSKLGQPGKVEEGDSPDGLFKILHYNQQKSNETYFIIFKSDGIVQSGYYNGVLFHDKQKRL